jgi:transposase
LACAAASDPGEFRDRTSRPRGTWFHFQKKCLVAAERDENKRREWREAIACVAIEKLKFLDESACHRGLTHLYGWAKREAACVYKVPGNTGVRQTIVGVLSLSGWEATTIHAGSLKGESFCAFLETSVLPRLSLGDVLVLDNARCHLVKKARELADQAGVRLVFLPAYSPDFSPIELAWRKVKASLRRAEAWTEALLPGAIAEALATVTQSDAQAFFRHCGYPVAQC